MAREFKVGAYVRVKPKLTSDEKLKSYWNGDLMDRTLGVVGVITSKDKSKLTSWTVRINPSTRWLYHECALQVLPNWRVKKLKRHGKI